MSSTEYLLIYPAFSFEPGVCHVVLSDDGRSRPSVLVGELEDNPGTSVTNAIERVAGAIAEHLLAGRTGFDLYEYQPRALPDLQPGFFSIAWQGTGEFSMPTWEPVDPKTNRWLASAQARVRLTPYTITTVNYERVIDATESSQVVARLRKLATTPSSGS